MNLRRLARVFAIILVIGVVASGVAAFTVAHDMVLGKEPAAPQAYSPDLEYLKELNAPGLPEDPRLIFVLMQQFSAMNRLDEGIAFYEAFLENHGAQLSDADRSLYFAALAQIRALKSAEIPLWNRIGWVNNTIAMFEQARSLSNDDIFIVHLLAGIVYTQLPAQPFGKTEQAVKDLEWSLANIGDAPGPGYDREIYYQLGLAHQKLGHPEEANSYLARSGYKRFDKDIVVLTNFSVEAERGGSMWSKQLWEVVPNRIYALSGYEFAEYFFVVSENGQELIAIDAGTRADSAEEAYTALMREVPNLPPLTTVLITHAHWDHIGGQEYFRKRYPAVQFHARANYKEAHGPVSEFAVPFTYFFGARYDQKPVSDFVPDVTHTGQERLEIGGTIVDLVPVQGGETGDALFFHFPQYDTLFVGDFIMPYFGAPFFEEGGIEGFYDAVDQVARLNSGHILHGHAPLTDIYSSAEVLVSIRDSMRWLEGEVRAALGRSLPREDIHHLNLIPDAVRENTSLGLAYLVLRENFINRVYDKHMGYWSVDLQGMDVLSRGELATILTYYVGLPESQLAAMVAKMNANGDFELASKVAVWMDAAGAKSPEYLHAREQTFLGLKQKYQSFNPFKFIIYSEMIANETPRLDDPLQIVSAAPSETGLHRID